MKDNKNKKALKELIQPDVEVPINDYPDSLVDNTDNTLRDIWGELWGDAE